MQVQTHLPQHLSPPHLTPRIWRRRVVITSMSPSRINANAMSAPESLRGRAHLRRRRQPCLIVGNVCSLHFACLLIILCITNYYSTNYALYETSGGRQREKKQTQTSCACLGHGNLGVAIYYVIPVITQPDIWHNRHKHPWQLPSHHAQGMRNLFGFVSFPFVFHHSSRTVHNS